MDELYRAALNGALVGAEKIIESIKSVDAFLHETVDGALHKLLAYWEAVAAGIRAQLGIVAAAGDDDVPESLRASAAAHIEEIKASAAA